MSTTVISADSTCDLSPELRERYHVETFPFHIEFRGTDHLDSVDITPQDLFEGYWEDGSLPTTGACSVEQYRRHFQELAEGGRSVIHFSLGSLFLTRPSATRINRLTSLFLKPTL